MPKRIDVLDRIQVASPCSADWDEMVGNEQVRFCRECSLYVHDLSRVTRKDALALVAASQGQLCVRYYKRPDGRLRTDERAAPLGNVRRRLSRLAAGAFSATLSLASNAAAQNPEPTLGRMLVAIQPAAKSKERLAAADPGQKSSLVGTVRDPNDEVFPGAKVTLTGEGGRQWSAETDESGGFRFDDLKAGTYKIKIEAEHFRPFERERLVLKPGVERRIAPTLDLGITMGAMIAAPDTLLVRAIWDENVGEVRRLLAAGEDVNFLDESTETLPLGEAARSGEPELLRTILDAGADPNGRSSGGRTALMMLDNEDADAGMVRALIAAGAKVNLKDEEGNTALHVAAEFEKAEVLSALIEAGAKVNASNKEGKTPLMVAAEEGSLDNVKALIAAGADPNHRSKEGETALKLAREYEYWEIVAALVAQGARE